MIVDASLGLGVGESLTLAGEQYRVVGLTKNVLTSGGDSVAFMTVGDAELVAFDQPAETTVLERQRVVEKLMGAPRARLLGLVLQQAWLLGALGYAVAFAMGELTFSMFPRRVLITETISLLAPLATMGIVTLASILGLTHVMRVDPSRALEG